MINLCLLQPRDGRGEAVAAAGQRLPLQQELEIRALPEDEAQQRRPRHARPKHSLKGGLVEGGLICITI